MESAGNLPQPLIPVKTVEPILCYFSELSLWDCALVAPSSNLLINTHLTGFFPSLCHFLYFLTTTENHLHPSPYLKGHFEEPKLRLPSFYSEEN